MNSNIQHGLEDLHGYLTVVKHLEPNSIRLVVSRYCIFLKWLEERQSALTAREAENFLYDIKKRLNLKNSSLNSYVFMLRMVEGWLLDRNVITEKLTTNIKSFAKKRPMIEILSIEEIERLLNVRVKYGKFHGEDMDYLNDIFHTFTRFLASTGCRFEEAQKLTLKNVDISIGRVVFEDTKNKETRYAWIMEPLKSELVQIMSGKKNTDLVFCNAVGNKIIPQNYGLWLSRAKKLANITKRVHPHIFRHTYGTLLYSATKDIGLVQVVLGHKDIKSTMIYIHLAGNYTREGMMRHPFVRKSVDPKELIKMVRDSVEGYELNKDERFDYLKILKATNEFTEKLFEATIH